MTKDGEKTPKDTSVEKEKSVTEWEMPQDTVEEVNSLEEEVLGLSVKFQNLDMQLESITQQIRQEKQTLINKQREKRALSKVVVERAIEKLGGKVPDGWSIHFDASTKMARITPPNMPKRPPGY